MATGPERRSLPRGRPRRRGRRPPPRLTLGTRRGLALVTGLGMVAAIGTVSVALAPDAGEPRGAAGARRAPAAARPAACLRAGSTRGGGILPVGFPVLARIRGGPGTYRSGGDAQSWTIELTSHASGACRHLHPVLVLVDRGRTLRPEQVRLSFHDGARWREVRMVHTDRDENIGAFESFPAGSGASRSPHGSRTPGSAADPGFSGFTLRPGQTVGIRVRLALTDRAATGDLALLAVVVQRRGDDGDWVGESGWYTFSVVDRRG